MSKKTGGPAFPLYRGQGYRNDGMTLRDYFAAKAMQSLCQYAEWTEDEVAELAYRQADAMIAEREKDND